MSDKSSSDKVLEACILDFKVAIINKAYFTFGKCTISLLNRLLKKNQMYLKQKLRFDINVNSIYLQRKFK